MAQQLTPSRIVTACILLAANVACSGESDLTLVSGPSGGPVIDGDSAGTPGLMEAEEPASLSHDADPTVTPIAALELGTGYTVFLNAVELEVGAVGVEMIEQGSPGTPSLSTVETLRDANPLDVFVALAERNQVVPEILTQLFEPTVAGELGWLRELWENVPPDIERYSCGNAWFAEQCLGEAYNHAYLLNDWSGSFYHQKTGPHTRYRSRACNQGTATYEYRVRRMNTASSSYVDWTQSFAPGAYYFYSWHSSAGIYRFRTEVNPGAASLSNMKTDVCVRYDLLSEPAANAVGNGNIGGFGIVPPSTRYDCGRNGCTCWGYDDCFDLANSGDCNGNPITCDPNNSNSCHCD